MELRPTAPPGNAQRKLRGFEGEIARLRSEGYTISAIREALEGAGIKVGWATVQREATRLAKPTTSRKSTRSFPEYSLQNTTGKATRPAADVDSFFDTHSANPLFRKKGKT